MMITLAWNFYPFIGMAVAGLLYVIYRLTLRLETKAGWAQAYIVAAIVAATVLTFLLPARVVEQEYPLSRSIDPASMMQSRSQAGKQTVSHALTGEARQTTATEMPAAGSSVHTSAFHTHAILSFQTVYLAGVVLMLVYFMAQLLWFARERHRHPKTMTEEGADVYDTNYSQPFSFGRSIFLPAALSGEVRRYVFFHELCHVRRHHFRRLCITELLLAINWFNPFVWLLFNELKLQQEFEVDADVLAQGIDRQQYQLSLLQMTVKQSRWLLVQSAFGTKPIKNRIVFMNKKLETRSLRRRLVASAAASVLVLTAILSMSCQMNEQVIVSKAKHHAIYGVWQMDFTRAADSQYEIYPPFKQYAFYSDDVFFTPHFSYRDGKNMRFGYSGEGLAMKGDTLVGGRSFPIIYRFINDNTFQSDWTKEGGDLSLANGKVNTDQWSRITPNPEIISLFKAAYTADEAHGKPLDGTYCITQKDGKQLWTMINGDVMLRLYYHQNDPKVYRFGGDGVFCEVKYGDEGTVSFGGEMEDQGILRYTVKNNEQITITNAKNVTEELLRKPLPQEIRQILAATLIGDENKK